MAEAFASLEINSRLKEDLSRNGFVTMTKVQETSIPRMLEECDIAVQSPTGTGKTMAFLTPILNHVYSRAGECRGEAVALVVAPTRELSLQIKGVADLFGVKCESFIGGISIEVDHRKMGSRFDVAVATPGRLFELLLHERGKFAKIKYLVLDEADKLLSLGFEEKLLSIVALLPKPRITCLFSATINESVDKLSKVCLRNPARLKTENESMPIDLDLEYLVVKPLEKLHVLLRLLGASKCIVFFATCSEVDFFHALVSRLRPLKISKIHGKMGQDERSTVYGEFMSSADALFCTDVAARGIDFKDIETVLHFDIPKDYTNIVHRSGRTARNGAKGRSIVFIMHNEKAYVEFLGLKSIKITLHKIGADEGAVEEHKDIKARVGSGVLDLAVKAFVSYIRSYKEHIISFILDYRGLDYNSLAELYFLERIPSMPEIRNVRFASFEKKSKGRRLGGRMSKKQPGWED
jgi:ATP-dependent RNA helicase DDX55/SPB4